MLALNVAQRFPELSWSWSRNQTFQNCKRAYLYAYYTSWGGWRRNASKLSTHAYRLKRLVTLEQMFGIAVHNQIHRMVNQFRLPTIEEFTTSVRKELNKAFWDSKHNWEQWYKYPSGDYNMLYEIYYYGEMPEFKIEQYRERMKVIAQNLLTCKPISDINNRKEEMKVITAERFRMFESDGIKVWVVLDLLFQDVKSGKFVIVDFKTGKPTSSDRMQLLLYALFLKEIYNLPSLDHIELRNEYLNSGKQVSFSPTQSELDDTKMMIVKSTEMMKSYLRDTENNFPLDMEWFDKTNHQATCRRCPFQELCGIG